MCEFSVQIFIAWWWKVITQRRTDFFEGLFQFHGKTLFAGKSLEESGVTIARQLLQV